MLFPYFAYIQPTLAQQHHTMEEALWLYLCFKDIRKLQILMSLLICCCLQPLETHISQEFDHKIHALARSMYIYYLLILQ